MLNAAAQATSKGALQTAEDLIGLRAWTTLARCRKCDKLPVLMANVDWGTVILIPNLSRSIACPLRSVA